MGSMKTVQHKLDRHSPIMKLMVPAWNVLRDSKNITKHFYGAHASKLATTDYHKVVLMSNLGLGYLCNPKYIAEALNRLYPGEFDLVLLVNKLQNEVPYYIRQVRYDSHEAQNELAKARFWIDNCRGRKYVPKRDDQVYIQAWHGYLGPKKIERDAEEHLPYQYVKNAKRDGDITDLMFANNNLYERLFKEAFWYNGPVIRCGMPRNRALVLGDIRSSNRIRRRYGVPDGNAICLYAPTFRFDESMSAYRFDYEALVRALEKRFGKRYSFAYRLHPNIAALQRPDYLEDQLDFSDYVDTQELLAACDVLVTDYSSILEDFMLTGRPGFVYASDIDSYEDDRGFYYPLRERPFPVATSGEELISNVLSYDEEEHRTATARFSNAFGLEEDGHGDECIARIIHYLSRPGTSVADAIPAIQNERSI